jgi:uncharacterized protein YneF (UPF0154 family)
MNYSKNLSRELIAKRVVLLCIAFLLIGFGVGYTLKTHISLKSELKVDNPISEQETVEFVVYGAYDDRSSIREVNVDWNTDLGFIPLDVSMDVEHQQFVFYICDAYNIDFSLVMALIKHESDFKQDVISKTNDYGYMQINVKNHEWLTETLGVSEFLDPYENIRSGMFILRKLFEKYNDSVMVLMAYNMGEPSAKKLWGQNIFDTNYTETVLKYQSQFMRQLKGEADAKVENH